MHVAMANARPALIIATSLLGMAILLTYSMGHSGSIGPTRPSPMIIGYHGSVAANDRNSFYSNAITPLQRNDPSRATTLSYWLQLLLEPLLRLGSGPGWTTLFHGTMIESQSPPYYDNNAFIIS